MPIALDNPSRKLSDSRIASDRPMPGNPEARAAAHRLTKLLTSAPIDLSGISDEIRRHPDLESLILRPDLSLAPSLVSSIDEPLSTIEEAVVVLGKSRLRTLIDQWSSTNSVEIAMLQAKQNTASS
jgi:HDOD domain